MVDPYAPPAEGPVPTRPTTYGAATTGQTYETYETYESPRDRRTRHEREHGREVRNEPRHEPAKPGLFWGIAAIGIGLLCLARLVAFFAVQDDIPNDQVAPALFATLGAITLSVGLALAAVLQRGLQVSWRIALLLGAGFFAIVGLPDIPGFGFL